MNHAAQYLAETATIAREVDPFAIERMAQELAGVRGGVWFTGIGGSAANASHAAADFRKLTRVNAYALVDSISEITARANDEGWETIFSEQLANGGKASDALFVLSVGGGANHVSLPLVRAIERAKIIGMKVFGIVGRDGGYTKEHGDSVIVVPTVEPSRVTPHTEGWQMVILHCLVSHPALQARPTKW